jgi:signal peptidase I
MPETKTEPHSAPTAPSKTNPIKVSEFIKVIVIAIVVAVTLRTFILEPRYIPSGSMEPTLQINDRILVDKLSYRFHPPQRGDILVFYPPFSRTKAYIKRLIAVGGDRVTVHNGQVIVNDIPQKEDYIAEAPAYEMPEVTVPNGYLWMMGDNRNNSNDSHVWGFLPVENVIGRAVIRFFPFDRRPHFLALAPNNSLG